MQPILRAADNWPGGKEVMSDATIEQLLEQIQRHLDTRQGARADTADISSHGDRFSEMLYETLEEARVVMDSIVVQPSLTPPHLPLLGGLWEKVRGQAHGLVVFYVNRLAGMQAVFNREIVSAISTLVRDLDSHGRADLRDEVAALREEVAALRAEVERLKNSAADSVRHPK